MTTEVTNVHSLMQACQRGVTGKGPAIEAANNLLAECYGELGRLSAEIEALRKDAERYRWLISRISKSQYHFLGAELTSNTEAGVDAAIDAAMTKEARP